MPRYAVLKHELPADHPRASHWDLLLEDAGMLLTWALEEWPPRDQMIATRLADHRLEYLTYQGPISEGRGHVEQIEAGEFQKLSKSDDQRTVYVQRLKRPRSARQPSEPTLVDIKLTCEGDSALWRFSLDAVIEWVQARIKK